MILEKVKKESEIINNILNKDRSLNFYSEVDNTSIFSSLIICFLTYVIILILSNEVNIFLFLGVFFALIGTLILSTISMILLNTFGKITRRKIFGNLFDTRIKIFKYNYITKKSEIIKYYNQYKLLSKHSKEILENIIYIGKNKSLEEIEKEVYRKKIKSTSLNQFLKYTNNSLENDVKELKLNKDEVISNKIFYELKKISTNDFMSLKDDIIDITEKLDDKSIQLSILKRIEELKFKHDSKVINKEIEKIKNNVEYNNKVLKSI